MAMLDPRALLGLSQQPFLGDYSLPSQMGGPLAQIQTPPPPRTAPAAAGPAHKGPGFLNVLDALFNDGGVGDALAKVKARKIAQAQRQQLMAAIDGLPDDERVIAMADPAKWAEAKAKGLEPYTLSADQERHSPSGTVSGPVKTVAGVDGGYSYTGNAKDGITFGGQRPTSHAEENAAERTDIQKTLAEIKDRLGTAGVEVARIRANRPVGGRAAASRTIGVPGLGAGWKVRGAN